MTGPGEEPVTRAAGSPADFAGNAGTVTALTALGNRLPAPALDGVTASRDDLHGRDIADHVFLEWLLSDHPDAKAERDWRRAATYPYQRNQAAAARARAEKISADRGALRQNETGPPEQDHEPMNSPQLLSLLGRV